MKKILIIIGKLNIGGAERVGRDIGYYADKSKFEIHYLVFGDEIGAYEQELTEAGCMIHHMNEPSKGYRAYYKNLTGLIKKYRYDVIHAHTMFSSGWAMLSGRIHGVNKRIAHSHTIKGPEKRGFVKNLYENIMRQIVINNSTDLVACGNGAGNWFYGKKVFKKRGKLIYNGIGLKEFLYDEGTRKQIREKYHLQDTFVIGHVGHLATVKNQKFLLNLMPEILKKKPNAVLLLLGDGKDREMLTDMIEKLQISDHVIMTGNVYNVGEYMSAMDVFVFPSLYEGMPLALVEAQANGLPCCISDKIPKDAQLTELVRAIPIEEANQEWIKVICGAKRSDAIAFGRKMYEMGFDTSGMLQKIYTLYEGS